MREVAEKGRLPVVIFCAGGIATPADAALMMQLGAEGIFVGSGIFKSSDPERRARAIVEATTHFEDPERVAAASRELGEAMAGLEIGRRSRPSAAACCSTAAGESPPIGVLALQGGLRGARAGRSRELGAEARRCARRRSSRGSTGS